MITISTCHVKSSPYKSYPNGELTAEGTVNFFTNQIPSSNHNPVKVGNVRVCNQNNMPFFVSDSELTVSCLRGIARSLIDIADRAEVAQAKLLEMNMEMNEF